MATPFEEGTADPAVTRKMILVVAFDIPEDDRIGFEKSQAMLQQIKPMFAEETGVKVYGAIRETAEAIIGFLVDGLPEPEEPVL